MRCGHQQLGCSAKGGLATINHREEEGTEEERFTCARLHGPVKMEGRWRERAWEEAIFCWSERRTRCSACFPHFFVFREFCLPIHGIFITINAEDAVFIRNQNAASKSSGLQLMARGRSSKERKPKVHMLGSLSHESGRNEWFEDSRHVRLNTSACVCK